MTIAGRFDRLLPLIARRQALRNQLKAVEAEMADDEEFVKDWFRSRPEKRRYRGVEYSAVTYQQIDAKKARRLLGKRAAEAEVTRTRETLSLDAEAKAVRELSTLKPVGRAERATA